jgi:hypothetical protein
MEKSELKSELDKSIIAYIYIIEKMSKIWGNPNIFVDDKHISYYKNSDNFQVYFDIIYTFKEIESLDDVKNVIESLEKEHYNVFSNYTFNKSGKLIKRGIFNRPDDTCCFLRGMELDSENHILKVSLGQEFDVYES